MTAIGRFLPFRIWGFWHFGRLLLREAAIDLWSA